MACASALGHVGAPRCTAIRRYHSGETLGELRTVPELARIADACGLLEFDVSSVTGPHRKLTQAISRFIHEAELKYAGIRYLSRFGTDQEFECWAIFSDRIEINPTPVHPIAADKPDLLSAAARLNLLLDPP
jgi:hypothetical protein